MEYIGIDGVCLLIEREKFNFIGIAVTPWHAHGIDCAIRYLEDSGVGVKGIILIHPAIIQGKIKYILNENNFINDCCSLYKLKVALNAGLLNKIREIWNNVKARRLYNSQVFDSSKCCLYIASAWHPNINLFMYIHRKFRHLYVVRLMVVEEGLSTYFPDVKSNKHIWNTLRKQEKGLQLFVSYIYRSLNYSLKKDFEDNTQWVNLNILLEQGNGIYPNPQAIKYYRDVITKYCCKYSWNSVPDLNDCIVLCSMAYLHSEIQDEADVNILREISLKFQQAGYKVYLKPHPRDAGYHQRYAPLSCEFLNVDCSVETLMARYHRIKAIVSFSSTSLVTAKLIFNIPAFSILNMLDMDKYGRYIQDEMNSFKQIFSSIVTVPESIEDLIKQLY